MYTTRSVDPLARERAASVAASKAVTDALLDARLAGMAWDGDRTPGKLAELIAATEHLAVVQAGALAASDEFVRRGRALRALSASSLASIAESRTGMVAALEQTRALLANPTAG